MGHIVGIGTTTAEKGLSSVLQTSYAWSRLSVCRSCYSPCHRHPRAHPALLSRQLLPHSLAPRPLRTHP
eukprot:1102145-Rhodomonas_salina.1